MDTESFYALLFFALSVVRCCAQDVSRGKAKEKHQSPLMLMQWRVGGLCPALSLYIKMTLF